MNVRLPDARVIEIVNVGSVRLERSARATRLSVSVRPFSGARVAVPQRCSFEQAERFARSCQRWLKRQLASTAAREQAHRTVLDQAPPVDPSSAKQRLAVRLQELAQQHRLPYAGVVFRRQRTVWGSCSARNRISANLKLARLTPALIDYVLLHELVHTRIKNHSAAFWRALRALVDDMDRLRNQLKQYPLHLL